MSIKDDVNDAFRVYFYDADSPKTQIAGWFMLQALPRRDDVLYADGGFFQVKLIEIDYKASNEVKLYVVGLGDYDTYMRKIPVLAKA